MSNTTIVNSSLKQLHEEYLEATKAFQVYASSNLIKSFHEGDQTYYKLLLKREIAYKNYKKAELLAEGREYSWNRIYEPVIQHRISRVRVKVKS